MKHPMKMNKLLSVIMSIAVALALLTGSIAAPILIRPFYYAQIQPLELESASGLSRAEIIRAYDEVLDYCIGVSDEFSAGALPFSESGSAHFADCRALFFPGKDNWVFNAATDPVILIMPDAFFRSCAIFILAVLLIPSAVIIISDRRKGYA